MSSQDDKTEEATSHKQQETRRQGNIPQSKDLSAAMLFLAAVLLLKYLGPWIAYTMTDFFRKMIQIDMPVLDIPEKKEIIPFALDWMIWLGMLVGPFLGLLAIAAYLVHYYQVGFIITTKPLRLKLNKINPINGVKRLFALSNIIMLLMNMGKIAIIGTMGWFAISAEVQNVLGMVQMEVPAMLVYAKDRIIALAIDLALLLGVLGYIDFIWQKRKHAKGIRMSKQDIKEEYKQQDGDPMIKNKRRQKQMEMAQKRMMSEVPQAEVVVRNPTHFAVALSYKPGMKAPVVVAKGQDKMALQIIDIARANGVPLIENPPLARELYRKVEVGDAIPPEFFEVVAQLIASVMSEEKRLAYAKAQAAAGGHAA